MLFESPEKQMNLHHRPPTIHVRVEILQVRIVLYRFVVGFVPQTPGKVLCEGGFARPDDSRNSYEHDAVRVLP